MTSTTDRSELTERSAVDLAAAIRRGELSAKQVVEAHIARHIAWTPRLNALIADRFDDARRDAEAADARVAAATPDEDLPPLLGVPFTVKESIALTGMPQSTGLVARGAFRSTTTAPVPQRLIDAGAIPLGVTNTSELTMWIESDNRLYGRTNNPYDAGRTAGGSSGGEGAAVGCGGSPFGIGSDIAGSIRIPAFFCGVFGHKPSSGLVPNTGSYPATPGDDAGRMLATGPLARRGEDLMPLLRVIAGPDGIDHLTRDVTLGDPSAASLEGLTVTTIENSSLLPMTRELRDARERAVGALLAYGAIVRRVEFRTWRRAVLPYLAMLQSGASRATLGLLSDAGADPITVRSLARRGGPHTLPTRLALAAELLPQMQGDAAEKLVETARELAAALVDTIGDGVVLHPAHQRVAPRHGRTVGRPWLFTPAAMFNLAGVPVTEVPLGLSDRGLPLGVQVAAALDRDHVSIAVGLALERVFGGWVPPDRVTPATR
jgi:fatty acid amide hydrolase 2